MNDAEIRKKTFDAICPFGLLPNSIPDIKSGLDI